MKHDTTARPHQTRQATPSAATRGPRRSPVAGTPPHIAGRARSPAGRTHARRYADLRLPALDPGPATTQPCGSRATSSRNGQTPTARSTWSQHRSSKGLHALAFPSRAGATRPAPVAIPLSVALARSRFVVELRVRLGQPRVGQDVLREQANGLLQPAPGRLIGAVAHRLQSALIPDIGLRRHGRQR